MENIIYYHRKAITRPRNFKKAIDITYIKRMHSLVLEIIGDETNNYKNSIELFYKHNGINEHHHYDIISRNHKN